MNIIESIKNILLMNGKVSMPFKSTLKSWYGEIEITDLGEYYVISGSCKHTRIKNIDTAVNYFCELCFSSTNYGYLYKRLCDKKMIDFDIEYDKITPRIKTLFKNEGILVDKELINIGVVKTKFPNVKKAERDLNEISKIIDFDILKDKIDLFNETYISIDSTINIRATFINDDGNNEPYDYGIGLNSNSDLSIDYINQVEQEHKQLTFKCLTLSCSINNDYVFHDIYLNKKASE